MTSSPEQRHRDAAADFMRYRWAKASREAARAGRLDDHPLFQAFARFEAEQISRPADLKASEAVEAEHAKAS